MASETRHWPLTLWPAKATVRPRLAPGQVTSPLAALNAREAQLVHELARLLGLSLLLVALVASMLYLLGPILVEAECRLKEIFGDEPLSFPADPVFGFGKLIDWAGSGLLVVAIILGLGGLGLWWLIPHLLGASQTIAHWPILRRCYAFWDWRRLCAEMAANSAVETVKPAAALKHNSTSWARMPAVRCQEELSQLWANTWHERPQAWPHHWAACPSGGRLLQGHQNGRLTGAQWAALGEQLEYQVADFLQLWRIWLHCLYIFPMVLFLLLTTSLAIIWFNQLFSLMYRSQCF